MTLQARGLPARILAKLAETGPMPRDDFNAWVRSDSQSESNVGNSLTRLREAGLIATKVMLTPAGLAELRRIGWKPDMTGVVDEDPAP